MNNYDAVKAFLAQGGKIKQVKEGVKSEFNPLKNCLGKQSYRRLLYMQQLRERRRMKDYKHMTRKTFWKRVIDFLTWRP